MATRDELVGAVALALKPYAPRLRQIETGEIVQKSEADVHAEALEAVRSDIEQFRTVSVPDFFGREAIRKTRDDARAIIKAVNHLTGLMEAKTLAPALRLRLGDHDKLRGTPADIANMPVPRLLDALQEVRDVCQAADENQPQADQVKHWCARIALRLMLRFSEDDPTAGSARSPYCMISSVLYQVVTGKEGLELRRICQDVLKPYHDAQLLPRRRS
jgi:hypothetical protein